MNVRCPEALFAVAVAAACPAQELGNAWGTARAEAAFYRIVDVPIPRELALEAGSFCTLPDGRLAIGTRRGEILLVSGAFAQVPQPTVHTFARGLDEVLGLGYRDGAFYVTQPAWVIMRDKGYGRVVNTSSNSGILGNFGQANYGAAKMGLVGFTRVLANEGRKYNIKANAIAPVAKTRMTEELMGAFGDKILPEEITPTVCWLAHEDCPVTGEIYSVAGGVVARYFIGLTPGYYKNGHSVEDVRDNWDQIRDESGYIVPEGPQDELKKLLETLSAE